MIDVNELRKGVTFEFDGSLFRVLDYEHNKPGRGNATIRIKARNLRTGATIDKTFQSGLRVEEARLDFHNVQYLYNDGDFYYFMDKETYEQPTVSAETLGESTKYLKPELEVKLTFYQGEPLDVELPLTIDLLVTRAEPSVRGNTATGVTKKVETETGLEVQVPSFIEEGAVIRVDTRSGSYVTRV